MVVAYMGTTKKEESVSNLKFSVGDYVLVSGPLYANSNAASATSSIKNRVTTITRIALGAKHPYNTTGDLGWMDESSITKIEKTSASSTKKTNAEIAKEVIQGKWGNGAAREQALLKAGYDYKAIQKEVNNILSEKNTSTIIIKKSNEVIAKEVIAGKWGNGAERKKNLTAAGYNYSKIQALVNKMLK